MSKQKPLDIPAHSNVSRSGHIWQVDDSPEQGHMLLMHRDGHHLWLRADGSVQIKAVKVPADNPNSGKLIIHAWGDALIKVNQDCNLDIGGKLTVMCDDDVDVHSLKDLSLKADGNINLNAGKNINLNAEQAIGMAAKSKVSTATPKTEVSADIQETTVTGPQNDTIMGERTIAMADPRGTFNIMSSGHLTTQVAGDHYKAILGKEMEVIAGNKFGVPLSFTAAQTAAKMSIIGGPSVGGRIEKIVTGNDVSTVVVGNKITNVVAGNSVMTAGAGSVTIAAGVNATLTATTNVTIAGAFVFLN